MSDLRLIAAPPLEELLGRLRDRLGHALPGARVVADGILGEESRIDWLAIDPGGAAVVVLVGDAGEDLMLVGRGLAQRQWVAARLPDWMQLAPELALRPEAGVRICLLCPSFRAETRAAARALDPGLQLVRYRCVSSPGGAVQVLLEHVGFDDAPDAPAEPLEAPSGSFRTGLSDADLGLSEEERDAFDGFAPGDPSGDGDVFRHG